MAIVKWNGSWNFYGTVDVQWIINYTVISSSDSGMVKYEAVIGSIKTDK